MLSDLQQKRVWEGQLAAEIRAVYFADLGNRSLRIQRGMTWMMFVCSSGAVATLLTDWLPPNWAVAKPLLAVMSAALSLGLLVARLPQNAAECFDLQFRYRRLALEFASLWDDMYSPDALATLENLQAKAAELEKSSASFRNSKRRMTKWQNYVERQHAASATA